jgi:hypothetical protein
VIRDLLTYPDSIIVGGASRKRYLPALSACEALRGIHPLVKNSYNVDQTVGLFEK